MIGAWEIPKRIRELRQINRSCNRVDTDVLCAILAVLTLAAGVGLHVISAGATTVIATFAIDAVINAKFVINTILQEYEVCGDADWKFCLDGTCWETAGVWACTPYPTDLTIKPIC